MKTRNYAWLTAILLIAGLLGWTAPGMASIANTKHNLSVTGPGAYKATSETQLCVFCHTPHNTNPAAPLWNHALSAAVYTPYGSNTLAAAAPGQPSGTSKLCLSCHDGTVALGGVQNLPFGHQTAGTISGLEAFLTGATSLGTDLRNDHPVSFTYDAALAATNPELVTPASLTGKIKPDSTGQLQCASCHDPHSETNPKFLHVGYQDGAGYGSPLCRTCHNKEYYSTVPNNPHRESTIQWNGAGTNPWYIPGQNLPNNPNSTPKANGCENCHQPHNSTSTKQLLKSGGESQICLVCHNGNVVVDPAKNIDAALNRLYAHPIKAPGYAGRHNPKRMPDGKIREDQADLANRHAECEDCHNPHAVSAGTSPNPPLPTSNLTPKVNKGVWGVVPVWPGNWGNVTTYSTVQDTTYQYQICLKCHSYYAFGLTPPPDPYGIVAGGINTDQAKEFNPNNASYHPVAAVGKNPFRMGTTAAAPGTGASYASSLINGFTPTSVMTCTECHSDALSGAGAGPKGPHGSDVWPILWAPYTWRTGQPGTQGDICFKCHDAGAYGVDGVDDNTSTGHQTGFSDGSKNLHVKHVIMRNQPCQGCHSAVPHGWKRRAMLVFGRGPGGVEGDPRPYNSHNVYGPNPNGGNWTPYGIPSEAPIDQAVSGKWTRSDCHTGISTGVGC